MDVNEATVTDAPESHYRIIRIMKDSARKAAKAALDEGFDEETFLHLAKTAARTEYMGEKARIARWNARHGKQ